MREIWGNNGEVLKTKIAFFNTDIEAVRYESHLISSMGGRANIAQGRKSLKAILLAQNDIMYFGSSISRFREDGTEYYDAREMADFFGYSTWDSFHKAIKRAMKNWEHAGINTDEHFIPTCKLVLTGKGYK